MYTKTGVFHSKSSNSYYHFLDIDNKIALEYVPGKKSSIDFLLDESYPSWILRHSLGKDMGPEDYSQYSEEDFLTEKRTKVLGLHQKSGSIRDLAYHGIQIPMSKSAYSHAVGPIHAGIIEPGHFRFSVEGEIVKHLSIRLGFQSRGILQLLEKSSVSRWLPIAETISGDTSIAYACLFSELLEKILDLKPSRNAKLYRSFLSETERIAIHIGDLGAIAEDIGYYPLFGVCATDRGAALGLMEVCTGNRFGKGAIRPGGVWPNTRIDSLKAREALQNLVSVFETRIEPQILRALSASTIRERLQSCGTIPIESFEKQGFVGPVARCMGHNKDLRGTDDCYKDWIPLNFSQEKENLKGDAWARFYLRYLEIKQSLEYLQRISKEIYWKDLWKEKALSSSHLDAHKLPHGIFYHAWEGWRGSLIASVFISEMTKEFYVRDASVPNWHALELAIRGELVGDFPLNNKSFNLSYVGFDL